MIMFYPSINEVVSPQEMDSIYFVICGIEHSKVFDWDLISAIADIKEIIIDSL